MRIHLHDHSGHAFTAHMARELAARGHHVDYAYSTQFEGPRGRLALDADDPDGLRIDGLRARVAFSKYSPVQRTRYEISYATAWARHLDAHPVDVVVAGNVPLLVLARMRRYFARRGIRWVLWHQDVYSNAIGDEAVRKLPGPAARLGPAVRAALTRAERAQVRDADAVIAIGAAFVAEYRRWDLGTGHVTVLPNWAPIADVTPGPRDNPWSAAHLKPDDAMRLLYAGTLGRKHNPSLLVDLLDAVRASGRDATLTVVSEGAAADDLARATEARADVQVLPFQPAEVLGDVLASADVCVALLEPSASRFSVPSKILNYLCAGRPVAALVPADNDAATEVTAAGGIAVPPTADGVREAAGWIVGLDDAAVVGAAARDYAEQRFAMDAIVGRFERVLKDVVSPTF